MIPKVRLVFDRKSKAGKTEEGDVEVYIYHMGSKRYLATGVRCRRREYKDGVVCMRADAVELNKRLQWCVRTIQNQVNDMVDDDMVSLDRLSLTLSDRSGDFLEWVEDIMSERNVAKATMTSYKTVLTSLRNSGLFKSWGDLTLQNIQKFDSFIRMNKVSTRRHYHDKFKMFINVAIEHDMLNENPYKRFKMPSEKRSQTIKYLSSEDLLKIEQCEVYGSVLKAKEMFLLGCYTGLRYSDVIRLSRSNLYNFEGREWIRGVQKKTLIDYNILLLPEAKRILERNNWDMDLLSRSILSYNLKRLAIESGVNKMLTMHMSRHTFATLALSKGVRIEVVSKMLGHTDINMTQVYAKVLQQDVAKGFELLSSGFNVK